MTDIARSNLSCRTFLFLFVLLGTPLVAQCATLEDSGKELARKIAAALPAHEDVALFARNVSSLTPDETSSVERAVRLELEALKVHIAASGAASVTVRVAFSENARGLLWTAEITQGDSTRAILLPVSRGSEFGNSPHRMPIVLRSEIFWEGPDRILDSTMASQTSGETRFVLLFADAVAMADRGNILSKVKIPFVGSATRDPRGSLEVDGNQISAALASRVCVFKLDSLELMDCRAHASGELGRENGLADTVPHDLPPMEKGAEIVLPENSCGAVLATGSGDYTQRDWVQAFSTKQTGQAISNKLEFAGPVMALRGGPEGARAIVRNLKTGNYEAYSLSCGK